MSENTKVAKDYEMRLPFPGSFRQDWDRGGRLTPITRRYLGIGASSIPTGFVRLSLVVHSSRRETGGYKETTLEYAIRYERSDGHVGYHYVETACGAPQIDFGGRDAIEVKDLGLVPTDDASAYFAVVKPVREYARKLRNASFEWVETCKAAAKVAAADVQS